MIAVEKDVLAGFFGQQHDPTCRYAMYNRHGGISRAHFSSLNCSYSVGDERRAVDGNRDRMKRALGIHRLVSVRQVHGDAVYCLEEIPDDDLEIAGYDAIMTDCPDVGIMIQHADCQAVLIYDSGQGVVAAVHSGWRGSICNIVGKVVGMMNVRYGSRPKEMQAIVSPSLGPCCSEFVNYRLELPQWVYRYKAKENHFDFWRITLDQLVEAGLQPASVAISGICTSCSPEYFSYRRARRQGNGVTGRNGSVIVVRKLDVCSRRNSSGQN